MQFLPLSAILPLLLFQLHHFPTPYPMCARYSFISLLHLPLPSNISCFVFTSIRQKYSPKRGWAERRRGREKNQLRGRNEQGATTGRRGVGFCGMRIAGGNDEKTGESPYFFVHPARARVRY